MRTYFAAAAAALCLMLFAAADVPSQTRQRVRIARGTSSAAVTGTVRGYAYRDHIVRAAAGQSISVQLRSPNGFTVFSIFQPNGENLDGAVQTNEFTGELSVSGDHVIRVGMMRAQARRRGSVSNYSLTITIN